MSHLQHLSTCTQSINATLFESFVVQFNQFLPFKVLKIIGILVQTKTPKPAWDVLKEGGVRRILRRLGASSTTTWRSSTVNFTVVGKIALMAVAWNSKTELTKIQSCKTIVDETLGTVISGQESIILW